MKRLFLIPILLVSFNANAIIPSTVGLAWATFKTVAAIHVAGSYVYGQAKAALIEAYKIKQVEDTKGK